MNCPVDGNRKSLIKQWSLMAHVNIHASLIIGMTSIDARPELLRGAA